MQKRRFNLSETQRKVRIYHIDP